MTEKLDADVTIVGYGPVGQLLALLLARQGWRIAIVERWPSLFAMPRAVHFDHEIARIFQHAGVGDAIQAIAHFANEVEFLGAQRQLLFKFSVSGWSQSAWPYSSGFAQPELEEVLDRAVRALPNVVLLRLLEASELSQSDDAVVLTANAMEIRDGRPQPTATVRTLRSRVLVGCDGAKSFVRGAIDTAFIDLGFEFDWLVVNLKWKAGCEREFGVQNICDPARPTSVVPGGPGRRRWEFMLLPGETVEQMDRADTAWELLKPWDVSPDNAVLERHAVYTFRAGWAERWRDGRVLLAGDAAHLMPPFMGQGMCSGMRDAATLSWQLGEVLGGRRPLTFLDNYTSERLAHVKTLIHGSIEHGRVICVTDPLAAAERDRRMQPDPLRPQPTPPPPRLGAGVTMNGNPHAGVLSFQGFVEVDGRRGRFDDLVGRGFTLIGTSVDPAEFLSPTNKAYLDEIGAVIAHVTPNGAIKDIGQGYAKWFANHGYGVVLSRPDFYQFAATDDPATLDDMVAALRAALQSNGGANLPKIYAGVAT